VRRRARIDPTARRVLQAIGVGRVGIGLGAILATGPALRLLGFVEPGPDARALARIAGGRDIALGVLTLAAARDRPALRAAAMLGVAVDAVDAISFGIPLVRREGVDQAALLGASSAAAATATGVWATGRLR
jgi:hypothetical protein